MDGVEFVFEDEPPDAPPPVRRSAGRLTWTARVAAAVAAVTAVAVWVATRPSPPAPAKAADPAAILQQHPGVRMPVQSGRTCELGAPVDSGVTSTMHRFLHGITIENMLATRCIAGTATSRRVVSELITGTTGHYDVQVGISDRNAPYAPQFTVTGGGLRQRKVVLGQIEVESAGVKVRITAIGFPGAWSPLVRLQRLADFLSLNTVL